MSAQTILVIDDSATERAAVEKRLKSAGYTVVTAVDGREGLRRLYETHPDLVRHVLCRLSRSEWRAALDG